MKKKFTIITSIVSLAACAALATGITFAALSSESAVDIAISTGSVDVRAAIDGDSLKASSVVWNGTNEQYDDVAQTVEKQKTDEGYSYASVFSNGGYATLSEQGDLVLKNVTGGDKLTFTIAIENKSSGSALYRTVVSGASGEYVIAIDGEELSGEYLPSAWAEIGGRETKQVTVTVTLPTVVQGSGVADCNIKFTLKATQINANVEE